MPKHEKWLDIAEDDLSCAKELKKSRFRIALYLTQQCAEKAFKAFIIYNKKELLKVHDLVRLMEQCAELDTEFMLLQKHCEILNTYISLTRYPDNLEFVPSKEMVKKAIKLAQEILNIVKNKIQNNQISIYKK